MLVVIRASLLVTKGITTSSKELLVGSLFQVVIPLFLVASWLLVVMPGATFVASERTVRVAFFPQMLRSFVAERPDDARAVVQFKLFPTTKWAFQVPHITST